MASDLRALQWEVETERHFCNLMESVQRLMECGTLNVPLSLAARLIEATAYEAARTEEPARVSRLILLAAELESLADDQPGQPATIN